MKLLAVLSISLLNIFTSCNNSSRDIHDGDKASSNSTQKKALNEVYQVKANEIIKDFRTWYNYTYHNIHLEQDFVGQDQKGNKIDKKIFLAQLVSGDFIAIKVAKRDNVPVYQLYKPSSSQADILRTMIQMAQTANTLSAMEGKELPEYHFKDLDGKLYNRISTKGKTLVIKCWFIHCVACVKEFPALNKLVEQYAGRKDVQFISLASDSKQALTTFLKKKQFQYAVVPELGSYMQDKLKVNAYPMHLLVDKNGKIVKATNSIEDLMPSLEKEIRKL
jgi:thiol-disulfide isomerase/thioredoxin